MIFTACYSKLMQDGALTSSNVCDFAGQALLMMSQSTVGYAQNIYYQRIIIYCLIDT